MRWQTALQLGLGVAAGVFVWRGIANTHRLEITRETIVLPGLDTAFDGFRLLHLTDLHLRQRSSRPDELLAVVETERPDLICLTGDYLFTALSLPETTAFFSRLSAWPAVGVFGNADYRDDTTAEVRAGWARFFPLLRNSALPIIRNQRQFWVVGVDDPHHGLDDLSAAMANVPEDATAVLLAHSPDIILRQIDPRIRLILSGHTHGGQMCLPGGGALYHNTRLPGEFASGRHNFAEFTLYVSRGIGSTRLPFRFNCLPEVTVFTLRSSGSKTESA